MQFTLWSRNLDNVFKPKEHVLIFSISVLINHFLLILIFFSMVIAFVVLNFIRVLQLLWKPVCPTFTLKKMFLEGIQETSNLTVCIRPEITRNYMHCSFFLCKTALIFKEKNIFNFILNSFCFNLNKHVQIKLKSFFTINLLKKHLLILSLWIFFSYKLFLIKVYVNWKLRNRIRVRNRTITYNHLKCR